MRLINMNIWFYELKIVSKKLHPILFCHIKQLRWCDLSRGFVVYVFELNENILKICGWKHNVFVVGFLVIILKHRTDIIFRQVKINFMTTYRYGFFLWISIWNHLSSRCKLWQKLITRLWWLFDLNLPKEKLCLSFGKQTFF